MKIISRQYYRLTLVFIIGLSNTSLLFIWAIFILAMFPISSLVMVNLGSRLFPLALIWLKVVPLLPSQESWAGSADQRECWQTISVLVWPWQVWRQ